MMLDHMTMPVLFAILIAVLAVVAIAAFLTLRIVGERSQAASDRPAKLARKRH